MELKYYVFKKNEVIRDDGYDQRASIKLHL
jgi:hypothetical protein